MKDINYAIEQFIELAGVRWKEWIMEFLSNSDMINEEDELSDGFRELLSAIQECLMDGDLSGLQTIREKFGKEEVLCNSLIKSAQREMTSYNDSESLRRLQVNDEIWKNMVDDIFINQILRYDPEFCERFEEYEVQDEEELAEIVRTLEVFVRICISNKYTKRIVTKACWELFRLKEANCAYLAEKIDLHWNELQMNYIIDKMSEI